jgi:hypothetical protein
MMKITLRLLSVRTGAIFSKQSLNVKIPGFKVTFNNFKLTIKNNYFSITILSHV